jgi:uncharacterized OsmC-like protein
MAQTRDIKTATERNIRVMRLKPATALSTARTVVTLRSGTTACEIEDGPWRLVADLAKGMGGDETAPDAGVFGRGAVGSCLVMGYLLWAARLGVRVDDARVTIETDFNAKGMYAVDDTVSPGWQALRYTVEITSPEPEGRVREVIEQADRHSPLLDDVRRPVPVTCSVRIARPAKE